MILSTFFRFFGKKDNIFPKTQEKNSKLKEKTQNSRKKLNVSEDLSSPTLPSDVKKPTRKVKLHSKYYLHSTGQNSSNFLQQLKEKLKPIVIGISSTPT